MSFLQASEPIQFRFFHIPRHNQDEEENVLNSFLRGHQVLTVHREFVLDKANSFWSFAVEYLEGAAKNNSQSSGNSGETRIDYKEVLSPEDFSIFVILRKWRRQAAVEAGIPVYTIVTNEQLLIRGDVPAKEGTLNSYPVP